MSDLDARNVDSWLEQVDYRWRTTGVPRRARTQQMRSLRQDIAVDVEAGTSAAAFTDNDPAQFADDLHCAYQLGVDRTVERTIRRMVSTSVLGALIGAALAWFAAWPVAVGLWSGASDNALVALLYPLAAFLVVTGVALALRLRFGRSGLRPRLLTPALVGLVLGCVTGGPVSWWLARKWDYPVTPEYLFIEALPVLAAVAFVTTAAFKFEQRRAL